MSSCSLSSMSGDKNPASTFDGRVNAGRILRELSESVLKTLTQIEPKSSSQAKVRASFYHACVLNGRG